MKSRARPGSAEAAGRAPDVLFTAGTACVVGSVDTSGGNGVVGRTAGTDRLGRRHRSRCSRLRG